MFLRANQLPCRCKVTIFRRNGKFWRYAIPTIPAAARYTQNCEQIVNFLVRLTNTLYICTTLKKGFFNSRTFSFLPYNKKIPPHKSTTAYTPLQSLLPVSNLYQFSSIFIYFLLSSYPLTFFSTNSRNHYNHYLRKFSFYFIEFLEIFSL